MPGAARKPAKAVLQRQPPPYTRNAGVVGPRECSGTSSNSNSISVTPAILSGHSFGRPLSFMRDGSCSNAMGSPLTMNLALLSFVLKPPSAKSWPGQCRHQK